MHYGESTYESVWAAAPAAPFATAHNSCVLQRVTHVDVALRVVLAVAWVCRAPLGTVALVLCVYHALACFSNNVVSLCQCTLCDHLRDRFLVVRAATCRMS